MEAKRTRLKTPYDADGKTNFPARNAPGVYLIYKEGANAFGKEARELRYVGYSKSDVYKALYRHFQTWNDRLIDLGKRNERITYKFRSNYKVRVIYTRTGAQAMELETALILKYEPRDNPDKLKFLELTTDGEQYVAEAESAEWLSDADNEAPF